MSAKSQFVKLGLILKQVTNICYNSFVPSDAWVALKPIHKHIWKTISCTSLKGKLQLCNYCESWGCHFLSLFFCDHFSLNERLHWTRVFLSSCWKSHNILATKGELCFRMQSSLTNSDASFWNMCQARHYEQYMECSEGQKQGTPGCMTDSQDTAL